MAQIFHLESFDTATSLEGRKHPEYLRGFEDASAMCRSETQDATEVLTQEFVSAFSDAAFSFAEARQSIFAELVPLINVITSKLLPAIATTGLSSSVAEILFAAIKESTSKSPTVSVHPSQIAAVKAALDAHDIQNCAVNADPSLAPLEAMLTTSSGEKFVNFQIVADAIDTALNTYLTSDIRKTHNG